MFESSVGPLPIFAERREVELLLCCARNQLDSTTITRVKALVQQPIDWSYLVGIATQHGLLPLLYWNLNSICPEIVLPTILGQLKNDFQNNAQRNLFLTRELLKLVNLLERHGISPLAFKGPVLAFSVYGNLALRRLTDLDILVRPCDVLAAKELLLSQGYRHVDKPTSDQEMTRFQSHYDYKFVRDQGRPLLVEMHWAFTPEKFFFRSILRKSGRAPN